MRIPGFQWRKSHVHADVGIGQYCRNEQDREVFTFTVAWDQPQRVGIDIGFTHSTPVHIGLQINRVVVQLQLFGLQVYR